MAPMSSFLDFALATGSSRITGIAEDKRGMHVPATDFYRPIRAAVTRIGRENLDAGNVFTELMMQVGDVRAQKIYPSIIEGYTRFRALFPDGLPWVDPVTTALPAGPGLSIAINPEVGYMINGHPHHLKLYLRSEALGQRRIDLTIAAMAQALPVGRADRLGILDLRHARVHYLSPKAAEPRAWSRLSALVHVEAAGFAVAWSLV